MVAEPTICRVHGSREVWAFILKCFKMKVWWLESKLSRSELEFQFQTLNSWVAALILLAYCPKIPSCANCKANRKQLWKKQFDWQHFFLYPMQTIAKIIAARCHQNLHNIICFFSGYFVCWLFMMQGRITSLWFFMCSSLLTSLLHSCLCITGIMLLT